MELETHRTWEFNVTAPLWSPTGEVKATCHVLACLHVELTISLMFQFPTHCTVCP